MQYSLVMCVTNLPVCLLHFGKYSVACCWFPSCFFLNLKPMAGGGGTLDFNWRGWLREFWGFEILDPGISLGGLIWLEILAVFKTMWSPLVVPVFPNLCACVVVPVYSKCLGDNGKREKASSHSTPPTFFFPLSPASPWRRGFCGGESGSTYLHLQNSLYCYIKINRIIGNLSTEHLKMRRRQKWV